MSVNLEQKFMSELLTGGTFVPDLLLDFYPQLGLDAEGLVFLLRLLRHKKGREHLFPDELAKEFSSSKEKLSEQFAALREKGLLGPLPQANGFSLEPLFALLFDLWAFSKMSAGQKTVAAAPPQETAHPPKKTPFGQLYHSFEKELGRCLSPMESEKISQWLLEDKTPPEVIAEALKRAVLQGKASFAYIDKILQSWQKQNFSSLAEVLHNDSHPAAARTLPTKPKRQTKSAYSSVYDKTFRS
ncbi:MAG: DnaD domain protein [Clostridiales bacterium]|nr:DnaD domain protein [Clostridiales bacterium]